MSVIEAWRDIATDSLKVRAFGLTLSAPLNRSNPAEIARALVADAERQGMAYDYRQQMLAALLVQLAPPPKIQLVSGNKPEPDETRWQREAQAEVDAICTSLKEAT